MELECLNSPLRCHTIIQKESLVIVTKMDIKTALIMGHKFYTVPKENARLFHIDKGEF
jgi:hypothetical protein